MALARLFHLLFPDRVSVEIVQSLENRLEFPLVDAVAEFLPRILSGPYEYTRSSCMSTSKRD